MSAETERPVLEVIRLIKAGSLDSRQLAAAERQACVMHLSAEGLSVPEIAQVLKRSDRTIARDRKAIQIGNKQARIAAMEPAVAQGRIRFSARQPKLPTPGNGRQFAHCDFGVRAPDVRLTCTRWG
ncbi:MAG: helix-turn-helix domain-containing protein [Planctomycetota bacterium]|nr:helix-turn-helix domain-containing protein [Planctomycetota bacterium]